MKKTKRILFCAASTAIILSLCSIHAFALSESEVQDKVNQYGRDAVTGNLLIWFLCAIAFLKISQKIDSFLSSLGINVGNTGGSMVGELMIAARTVAGGGRSHSLGGGSGGADRSGSSHFLQYGLGGAVARSVQRGASQNATGQKSGGVGGAIYNSSVSKGGSFANRVIGDIANGSMAKNGSISGDGAENALKSYLGYNALGPDAKDIPSFSNVEMGGGRIMATETSAEHPDGIAMGLYSTDQYMAPEGDYTTVTAADGSTWYKQYAQDAVQRNPITGPDGKIDYDESIVKKLPKIPARKDRV